MAGTVQAFVYCSHETYAEKEALPLNEVRLFNGKAICQICYEDYEETVHRDEYATPRTKWRDLPPVTLADLCEMPGNEKCQVSHVGEGG